MVNNQAGKHGNGLDPIPPNSPALPSEFDTEIPSSPIDLSSDMSSNEFGSTPAKSYMPFPRTPTTNMRSSGIENAPSSRLRHTITMRNVIEGPNRGQGFSDNFASYGSANASFDMTELNTEMNAPTSTIEPSTKAPPTRPGQVQNLTIKEQEKLMDEIKKENFDLKLRVSLLQERLALLTPESIEGALSENIELKVQNEALAAENRTYKNLVSEAHGLVEQLKQDYQQRKAESNDQDLAEIKAELEQSKANFAKTQVSIQRYESQMSLFDRESRESAQKVKQLELDLSSAQKRLVEANNTIIRHQQEISALEEELANKNELTKKFKDDFAASTSDMALFTRQIHELQEKVKKVEAERDAALKDRECVRKGLEKAETQLRINNTLSSPRNSLDVLESKLLKELGHAQKRVNDLEKQTNLTQGERDQLISQTRRTGHDLMMGIKSMQVLAKKIIEVAFPGRNPVENIESLTQAVEQIETLCKDVLFDLEESRINCRDLEQQVTKVTENYQSLNREKDQMTDALSAAEMQVQKLSLELYTKNSELRQGMDNSRTLQNRIRELTEQEIPRYQRDYEKAQEKLKQLGGFVENYERQLQTGQVENEDLRKKFEEMQQIAIRSQTEATEFRDQIAKLQQLRDQLYDRLSSQEHQAGIVSKKLDELQGQVGYSEKVKSVVEEQFNRELKALHASNSELKNQLSSATASKSDLSHRVDKLSQLLRELERSNEELIERSRTSESSLSTLRREYEILLLEHKTMEEELVEKQSTIARLEQEIGRIRREDFVSRRNYDGLEHLQAKVESLSALNNFLKEQSETRERTIKSLEERLIKQEEQMRLAYEEVEVHNKKLKKREMLISQALKRLESINYMRQQQATSSGSPFRDDHHPILNSNLANMTSNPTANPTTPTRPSKRPNYRPESLEF